MITHRIGSARIAGRIIVMEKGRIVETGTHEQLMENNGYYRLMFETQKKWYQ
jgi:ATP-binding cassette subfamily B protein